MEKLNPKDFKSASLIIDLNRVDRRRVGVSPSGSPLLCIALYETGIVKTGWHGIVGQTTREDLSLPPIAVGRFCYNSALITPPQHKQDNRIVWSFVGWKDYTSLQDGAGIAKVNKSNFKK